MTASRVVTALPTTPEPGRKPLADQVAGDIADRHAEDQFVCLFVDQEKASRFAVQDADRAFEQVLQQRFESRAWMSTGG